MKRKFLALLIIVALAITAAIFWTRSRHDSHLETLRVGYMVLSDCAPLFNTKIFEDNGLKLELKQAPGGAVILNGVIGDSLDLGFSNLVSPILARAQGIDVVAAAGSSFEDDAHSRHALVVKKGSPIKGAQDLKGKTVAVNTLRNIDHLMLIRWLRLNGLSADSIRLVEVPFPRMDTVLMQGNVDAVAIVEPFLTKAKEAGHSSVGDYYVGSGGEKIEVTSYFAKRSWLAKNSFTAKKFQKALAEAITQANGDEKQFRELIRQVTGIDQNTSVKMGLPGFSSIPTKAGFEFLIKEAKQSHFIEADVKPEDLLWNQE